jgi:hypothetical protein
VKTCPGDCVTDDWSLDETGEIVTAGFIPGTNLEADEVPNVRPPDDKLGEPTVRSCVDGLTPTVVTVPGIRFPPLDNDTGCE